MVLQLAWRGDWSPCGGLRNFRLHRLGWWGFWFRCGGPYRRLGGAWHWLGRSAGDYDGHCGGADLGLRCGADLGLRCGAGWHWRQTRGVGGWNLRLHGSCRCWHSWWRTQTEEEQWESEMLQLKKIFYLEDRYYFIICHFLLDIILQYIFSLIIYIPGTHVLISLASIMLSGQTQVYLGGCLPTWGAARHKNSQPDTWHQSLPAMDKRMKF